MSHGRWLSVAEWLTAAFAASLVAPNLASSGGAERRHRPDVVRETFG